jgi:hypothetical protein
VTQLNTGGHLEPFAIWQGVFARNNGRKRRRIFPFIFFSPDGRAFVPRHAAGYFVQAANPSVDPLRIFPNAVPFMMLKDRPTINLVFPNPRRQ